MTIGVADSVFYTLTKVIEVLQINIKKYFGSQKKETNLAVQLVEYQKRLRYSKLAVEVSTKRI